MTYTVRNSEAYMRSQFLSSSFVLFILIGCCTTTKTAVIQLSVLESPEIISPHKFEASNDLLAVSSNNCPEGMIEIQGYYYPTVQQQCLYMVDIKGNKTDEVPSTEGRCGEFSTIVVKQSNPVNKHYCIDTYELPNKKGEIPLDWLSWYDVKNMCESQGKRMCSHSEWAFAAEGPNMHPYPYGDGFHRDKTACNFDNTLKQLEPTFGKITGDDVLKVSKLDSHVGQALHSLLVPSGSNPNCVSDWGVHDMPGNIDEWVVNESGKPYASGLVGGHVFGVRNASRPMTTAHGPEFKWYESGGRCCQDINE